MFFISIINFSVRYFLIIKRSIHPPYTFFIIVLLSVHTSASLMRFMNKYYHIGIQNDHNDPEIFKFLVKISENHLPWNNWVYENVEIGLVVLLIERVLSQSGFFDETTIIGSKLENCWDLNGYVNFRIIFYLISPDL